uniref:Tudor domain-containing protein n=1 Tax=Timema cristinae TaxID=61476 RepID=A0A7R9D1G3_TIMCR|nr:unnamed protein product [Timema cristinae]
MMEMNCVGERLQRRPRERLEEQITENIQRAVGRIIGKGGETIRSISRASNAKITVENISQTDDKAFMDRRVIIKGSVDQISLAKSMIEEKVEEDSEERRNIERSMASRSPRQHPNKQYLTSAAQEELKKEKSGHLERLVPTGRDGFMEVYVSAVEGPSQFWLQVYGPRAIELDHLEMQMTDYYKSEENRKLHAIKELEEGQIVAAPFLYDNKWYRAEVTKVTLDDYNIEDSKVSLYYVDYGDSSTRSKHEVCELRTDFLRLRFQAIECCLARVKPRHAGPLTGHAGPLTEHAGPHIGHAGVVPAKGLDSSPSIIKRTQTIPEVSPSFPLSPPAPLITQSSEKAAGYLLDKEGNRENKERS